MSVVSAVAAPPDPITRAYRAAVPLPVVVGIAALVTYRDALASAQ